MALLKLLSPKRLPGHAGQREACARKKRCKEEGRQILANLAQAAGTSTMKVRQQNQQEVDRLRAVPVATLLSRISSYVPTNDRGYRGWL
jgi:hypothetical protein